MKFCIANVIGILNVEFEFKATVYFQYANPVIILRKNNSFGWLTDKNVLKTSRFQCMLKH